MLKLRDTVRGRTRRTDGRSWSAIIDDLNPACEAGLSTSNTATVRLSESWTAGSACGSAVSCVDGKAAKGEDEGSDHQRWPNAYFAAEGLFTMQTAHAALVSVPQAR